MPFDPPQPLPTGDATTDALARELAALLGPAYQPAEGTNVADDLRALASPAADGYDAAADFAAEAFGHLATDLLPDWEQRLGLPVVPTLPAADRRAVIAAKVRETGASSLPRVLAAVQAFDPTAAVHKVTASEAGGAGQPRAVFRAAVTVAVATWDDATKRARVLALLDRMAPPYAEFTLGTTRDFRCDDPDSLCDRDLLAL